MKRDGKAGRRENKAGKKTPERMQDWPLQMRDGGTEYGQVVGGGWTNSDFIRMFYLVRLASSL